MPEQKLLDTRSNSARKAVRILKQILAEFDQTNDAVIDTPGIERESTGVIIDFPTKDILTRKVIPESVRRIVDSGIDGPSDREDKPPANVLNVEGLSLPEYAKRRHAAASENSETVEIETPKEVPVNGEIINPEGKTLPQFMVELVEKRKGRLEKRPEEKAA